MKTQTHLGVHEPIVALSSPAGPGARGIVRLTGDGVFEMVRDCFRPHGSWPEPPGRSRLHGDLLLPEVHHPLPGEVLLWPAPRTYTGQDLVEIHALSSPPLLEALIAHLLKLGARAAGPGEFTLRAFLGGKLDLTRAEAVLGVIEAHDAHELKTALAQLAGNLARPLHALRDDLLNVLAEVEAALDFAEEDLQFLSGDQLASRLAAARTTLLALKRQLSERNIGGRPFRVVLTGPPNVGKSSLFNALIGGENALVDPEPGTTRDYLRHRLDIDGVPLELIDTAGKEETLVGRDFIEVEAQRVRAEQVAQADLLVACHDASRCEGALVGHDSGVLTVWTKCDAAGPIGGAQLRTSALTGAGVAELRALLAQRARAGRPSSALAPSWSRCRHHVETALHHLENGQAVVERCEPPELLALELRLTLEQLGEMVGEVYTDDLLDRIFGQFCIGK